MIRPRVRFAGFSLASLVCIVGAVGLPGHAQARLRDWRQFGGNASHSGAPQGSTGIGPGALARLIRRRVAIDGVADSSPVYLHGALVRGRARATVFVTTEYGKTEAIDANSGAILWEFTPGLYEKIAGTGRITTASPAAGPSGRFLYTASPGGYITELRVRDGHPVWRTRVTLDPSHEKLSSSLTVEQDRVIAVVSGFAGDLPPYQGHLAVIDRVGGRLLGVWNAMCSDQPGLVYPGRCARQGGGVWGRAGAVVAANGDLLLTTGNGFWDGRSAWGDSVVELDPDGRRMISGFTPRDWRELDYRDLDLGSTSPALLGHGLVAVGGKQGRIRLVRLGRSSGGGGPPGRVLETLSAPSGREVYSALAVWRNQGQVWLFASDNGGLCAWRQVGGRLQREWRAGVGGTSPVVAGGLLYVYSPQGGLRVYEPTSGRLLAVLPCGPGHWESPIIVDGKIILAEGSANGHSRAGLLDIWSPVAQSH